MKKWEVDVHIDGHYTATVEAETEEEACQLGCEQAAVNAWMDYNVVDCKEV